MKTIIEMLISKRPALPRCQGKRVSKYYSDNWAEDTY